VRDTDDAGLIFKEFDGKTPNGLWDRQGPPQPPDFKYAVKRDALEMYSNTPFNQHLVREGVAIDPSRHLFNGQPSLVALCIDRLALCPGQHVDAPVLDWRGAAGSSRGPAVSTRSGNEATCNNVWRAIAASVSASK
jgi:hypothetical protein